MLRKSTIFFLVTFSFLFLLDGGISVIDEIIHYYTDKSPIFAIRTVLAYFVLFLGFPYIFTLFFLKSQKTIFYWLIPISYSLSILVSSYNSYNLANSSSLFNILAYSVSPHWIYSKHLNFYLIQLSISLIQLIVGGICFKQIWSERKTLEIIKGRYILGGFVTSSFVLGFLFINVAMTASLIVGPTQGFLGFDGSNIQSVEKIYKKNGKVVHLIPMIHIGSESFYKEINNIDATKKTLFLLEGVSDEKKLMQPLNYRGMASSMGLESQQDHFSPPNGKHVKKNIYYQTADIDASQLNKGTRDFINNISKMMNEKSMFELIISGKDLLPNNQDAAQIAMDVLDRRNKIVISKLKENEGTYEEFYIPWGAMHLPEIEREIIKMGYKQESTKERNIISLAELVQKFSKK